MQNVENFYNILCPELLAKYFPTVKFFRDNVKSQRMCYAIELFSNGCITYSTLIKRIVTQTKATETEIHSIVEKYVDFQGYIFQPKN